MEVKYNLLSLEILRDFVRKNITVETYMKNLIIENIETPNERLWVLREFLKKNEEDFAKELNTDYNTYHKYEKKGYPVPCDFLKNVADKFAIRLDWLLCKSPMFPMPKAKRLRKKQFGDKNRKKS